MKINERVLSEQPIQDLARENVAQAKVFDFKAYTILNSS